MIPRRPSFPGLALACAFASAMASAVVAQPSGKPLKWACIGNSITAGYIVSASDAYPAKLGKLLGPGFAMENDGVSSTTLLKAGDLPYWTHGRLSNVFAFKPDIITIKLGTNDSKPINWDAHKGEFERDYLALIDTLSGMAQKPRIILCLPVPAFVEQTGNSGIRGSILKNEILPLVKKVAGERGLAYLDLNTPMAGLARLFPDSIHPNAEGQDSLAHFIYRAIASSLPTVARAAVPPPWPEISLRQGILSVSLPGAFEARARLFSADGREWAATRLRNGEPASLAVSGLSPGRYFLSVEAPSLGLRAVKALSF